MYMWLWALPCLLTDPPTPYTPMPGLPACLLQVEDVSPHRSFKEFMADIFDTARNLTTSYLLVYVVGNNMLAVSPFNVTTNLQYLVIGIPNLLSGVDSMTTYLALSLGIWIFQKFLIK